MDIEFVEQKHRDDVFQFMEITGMSMNEAYRFYEHANFNLETAIQMHLSKSEHVEEPLPEVFPQQLQKEESGDFDEQYEKYRAWKLTGESFRDKYDVRREQQTFINSLIPKMLKPQPEAAFKKKLESFIGRTCPIKFSAHSLTQTLEEESCMKKFPIIVHVIKFVPEIRKKLVEVLCTQQIVFEQLMNVQFRNFGLDVDEYELQPSMKPFIDIKNDVNSFVLFRVNIYNEVQVLGRVRLVSATKETIEKQLKKAKTQCIQKQMDEVHYEKRFGQEEMGNYQYVKPMSINEKRKIAQDRALRKKQEEEFYASMKAQEQKEKEREKKKQVEIKNYSVKEENGKKEEKKVVVDIKDVEKKREQMRKSLKIYQEGMMIKLRLPSGESRKIVVDGQEKVSYLYNFVESENGDCGFENQQQRQFDILRPYDQLSLSEHLHKTLREVFEDSDMQSLNVREKE